MPQSESNQVFFLMSNKDSLWVKELYHKIQSAAAAFGKTVLLYHSNDNIIPSLLQETEHHAFGDHILNSLHYQAIDDQLIPGSNHFPVLDYYLKYPTYDHYWYIEDDVRLNGDWHNFFRFFSEMPRQADFISCHIRRFHEEPLWNWWNTLFHESKEVPRHLCLRSFNPIFRISNAALRCIHQVLTDKWQGHHEVLLPTVLHLKGFDVMDFGGLGKFVPPGLENKFYIDDIPDLYGNLHNGTVRYRPVIQEWKGTENLLFHPVKMGVQQ